MTPFYNEPAFWAFLSSTFLGLFGVIKFYFMYKEKLILKGAQIDISVEGIRAKNMQRSVDYLNGAMARIEPMVLQQENSMSEIKDALRIIDAVERGLKDQFAAMAGKQDALQKYYEDFQRKLQNATVSMQTVLDKINKIEAAQKMAVGTVTYKP